MPHFRIYRMKDSPRQQFRWAPHVSGCASIKPKDYELSGEIDALHEYDSWKQLRESNSALQVGDLLEAEDGRLRICKYVGFEPAQWLVPEPAPLAVPDWGIAARGGMHGTRRPIRSHLGEPCATFAWATISTIFACAASA